MITRPARRRSSEAVTRCSRGVSQCSGRRPFRAGSGSSTARQAAARSLESMPCQWLCLPSRRFPRLGPTRRLPIRLRSGSACCPACKLNTGAAHFDTYLRGTRGLAYDPGASVIRVAAANPFHVPWLEGKLSSAIHTAVAEWSARPCAWSSSPTPLPSPTGQQRRQRPAPLLAPLEVRPSRRPPAAARAAPAPHAAGRRAVAVQCALHVRQLRRRPVQPAGPRRVAGHRRSPGQRLQPAVPVRRRRSGQNAPAARHRPRRRRQAAPTSSTSRPRRSPTS